MNKENIQIGGDWHNHSSLINHLNDLSQMKTTQGVSIVGPWSNDINPLERAQIHMTLLAATYGSGHPGSKGTKEEMLTRQQSNSMLTWIVRWNGFPVGMVNFDIQERGIAEVVRSVELPKGTVLPNGTIYDGQANISAAMYKRIPDLLDNINVSKNLWAIEGDIRLAADIVLPSGEILPSGVRTQHINNQSGLKPYLLVVPRYRVHPEGGNPHQETFIQSRLYLQNNKYLQNEPIYTPSVHPSGNRKTIADIVKATYNFAHNFEPLIVAGHTRSESDGWIHLEQTAVEHFSTITASGNLNEFVIKDIIAAGLEKSRFVEIILDNKPENIELQQKILKLGIMPLGVFPGCEYNENGIQKIKTTIHYGIARPDIVRQMVKVNCASDYKFTKLEQIIYELREEWREHE